MSTRWYSFACDCIILYDSVDPADNHKVINGRFEVQCKTHNTPNEALATAQTFMERDGPNPTIAQLRQAEIDMTLNKLKPGFKRRSAITRILSSSPAATPTPTAATTTEKKSLGRKIVDLFRF